MKRILLLPLLLLLGCSVPCEFNTGDIVQINKGYFKYKTGWVLVECTNCNKKSYFVAFDFGDNREFLCEDLNLIKEYRK